MVTNGNVVKDEFNLGDGYYYIRARAIDGPFGEASFFTVRTLTDTLVSDEDKPFIYQPIEDEYIELLESFPNSINSSEKANVVSMKFSGIIDLEDIDFEESFMQGQLSDYSDEGNGKEHRLIDGSYSVVHDEVNNLTYILFIPDAI